MFDHSLKKDGKITKNQYPHNIERKIVNGLEFFKINEFTWAPWGYLYRRKFLIENNLKFVEKVQFEDVDFVIDCILHAKSICFDSFSSILYTHNEDSQTNIGNDTYEKIDFLAQLMDRVRKKALIIKDVDYDAFNIVRNHYLFGFKIVIKRLIYLNYSDKKKIIYKWYKNSFNTENDNLLFLISKYPFSFCQALNLLSPLLKFIVKNKKTKQITE